MALPSSGQISISQVSVELGRASTATTSLGESAVRTLAGVPSGAIAFTNLHGKTAESYSQHTMVTAAGYGVGVGYERVTDTVIYGSMTPNTYRGSYIRTVGGYWKMTTDFLFALYGTWANSDASFTRIQIVEGGITLYRSNVIDYSASGGVSWFGWGDQGWVLPIGVTWTVKIYY